MAQAAYGTFHQLVHTLSYGDAISGEVLALQRCARERGYESEIFAINIHPAYQGKARKYAELSQDYSGDVWLHYSLGSPLNECYRNLRRARRTLVYHNLTPARWFAGINPRIVDDIERGARELPALCAMSDRLIADSEFNAGELKALGFHADVLTLPIDPARWSEPANAGIASLLRADPSLHVLHVGRLAPNKCIEDIIKIFYFIHHVIEPRSKLWLAGIDIDTELYSFSLKRLARELESEQAIQFVGSVADSELRALYENSSVYLCMSEHEGFCLPLIEAMHFGLPVIAYAAGAVPATVGHGGVLVKEKRHMEIAELAVRVCRDAELRARLVGAGRVRVQELSYDRFCQSVERLLTAPAGDLGGRLPSAMSAHGT